MKSDKLKNLTTNLWKVVEDSAGFKDTKFWSVKANDYKICCETGRVWLRTIFTLGDKELATFICDAVNEKILRDAIGLTPKNDFTYETTYATWFGKDKE